MGLLLLALRWPRLARALFVFVFLAASLFNSYTAFTEPEVYLNYASMAVLAIYRDFINGAFAAHTQLFVLAIAAGQLCVSALLTRSGSLFRLGVIGGFVFFVSIAPLGFGSAFPSTLLLAIALLVLHYNLRQQVTTPQNS